MAGYFLNKRVERERTRMEQVAFGLRTSQLVDFVQQYLNSAGAAGALYARAPDPDALDVMEDNLAALTVLVKELRSRVDERAFRPEDPHLADLVAKFNRRNVGVSAPEL